jgi:hypothetical protein
MDRVLYCDFVVPLSDLPCILDPLSFFVLFIYLLFAFLLVMTALKRPLSVSFRLIAC